MRRKGRLWRLKREGEELAGLLRYNRRRTKRYGIGWQYYNSHKAIYVKAGGDIGMSLAVNVYSQPIMKQKS
jgi:hypothetical protein